MSNLLGGVRVIESAQLFNGDSLGMFLADLGADVIKVESPFLGDYLRDFLGQITPHHSPAHMQVNKNKRSIGLDLRKEEGREVFWRLLDSADVFIDGNAFDALANLGVGYENQRERKPDIIYCQYSGYGSDGPYAPIPTHGQMMNALAAATPVTMGEDGFMHPVHPAPGRLGSMLMGGDGTAAGAIHAALHVAAALSHRARTGEGCFIDVAGHDGVIAQAWIAATYSLNAHRVTDAATLPSEKRGDGTSSAKYQWYETRDRKALLFCCIEPKFWRNFCNAIDRPDLLDSHDAGRPVDFGSGDADLRRELQRIFHSRDLADWMELAAERDIALGPAPLTLEEAKEDPHLQSRGIFVEGRHPHAGPFTYVGEAAKVAGQPYEVRHPAPLLGEHTWSILGEELGISAARLAELAEAGVITQPDTKTQSGNTEFANEELDGRSSSGKA
jgi:crotonobetainyl-CoA:carnitine CoA-transferase CaiB-like acyl-CoA transferase